MALAGRLLVLLAVALVAVSIAGHKAAASGNEEHGVNGYQGRQSTLQRYQCSPLCDYRCSDTKYRKPCLFFCNKCCNTCLCVPSGFYGHKYECPCYNNWKTKEGGPKCP